MRVMDLLIANTLKLSDSQAIVRDSAGIPTAFRVLRSGKNALTLNGEPFELDLTPARLAAIVDYAAMKGEAIPVDAEHFLHHMANAMKLEEADLVKANPKLGEIAAHGFVKLSARDGELWASVVKWSARAKQVLSGAADSMAGFISPVIRGIKDGNLRVTSIALTNEPALNDQDLLVARGEEFLSRGKTTTEKPMKDLITKLATLLKLDGVALTAEHADLAPLLTASCAAIVAGQAAIDGSKAFVAGVKDALSLTDTDTLQLIQGKVLSLAEKSKADTVALTDAQSKLAAHDKAAKAGMIKDLKAAGKLTDGMTAWAEGLDVVALTAWAKDAPVIVPVGRELKPGEKPADTVALTDADTTVARACGLDPKHVQETMKGK